MVRAEDKDPPREKPARMEDWTKGELLTELLHRGQEQMANSTRVERLLGEIDLQKAYLFELNDAWTSYLHGPPEMQPLAKSRIEAVFQAVFPIEDPHG